MLYGEVITTIEMPNRLTHQTWGIFIATVICIVVFSCKSKNPKSYSDPEDQIHISHEFPHDIHVEPHLAIHPKDNQKLCVATMVFDKTSTPENKVGKIRIFTSVDAGNTWQHSYTSLPSRPSFDPWVQIGTEGQIIVTALLGSPMTIYIFSSSDWGKTWSSNPVSRFGKGSYDHPTASLLPNGDLVVVSSQAYKRSFGARVIHFDRDLSIYNTSWFGISPFDFTAGSFHLNDNLNIGISLARNAEKSKGYQEILAHPTTEFLRLNIEDSTQTKLSKVASHDFMGSFPVLLGDRNKKNHLYLTRHIYDNYERRIYLWTSIDSGDTWNEYQFENENITQRIPQLAQNNEGILGISWIEQDESGCFNIKFGYSKDRGSSFSQMQNILAFSSCAESPIHDKVLLGGGGRSISDRYDVGGDYYGFAANDSSFCFAFAQNHKDIFQLYYTTRNANN